MYLDAGSSYHYFIGRSGQSVQTDVMIRRVDQLQLVNRAMAEATPEPDMVPEGLYRYMIHFLSINSVVTSFPSDSFAGLAQLCGQDSALAAHRHDVASHRPRRAPQSRLPRHQPARQNRSLHRPSRLPRGRAHRRLQLSGSACGLACAGRVDCIICAKLLAAFVVNDAIARVPRLDAG